MLKKIYVFFILLVSAEFFTLSLIGEEIQKILEGIAIVSMLILISVKLIANSVKINEKFYKSVTTGIIIILIAVFLSSLSAFFLYGQPLPITLVAQRSMYFYLLFFFLFQYNIEKEYLEKLLIIMGVLFTTVYLSAIYSPDIVKAKILEERGTFRIGLPGIIYIIIGLFYSLQNIIYKKKFIYIFLILLFISNIITTGTRSIIGVTILLSTIYLYNSIKSKNIFSTILAFIMFLIGGIIFYNIIEYVLLLYEKTLSGGETNFLIRIYTIGIFFTDLFKNDIAYVLGNGFASELSSYGKQLLYLKKYYGLYLSDIGIIGDYIRYGLFYIIGVIIIIKSIIENKNTFNNSFISYSFYFIILSIFTLSNFGTQSVIPAICILLYLIVLAQDK